MQLHIQRQACPDSDKSPRLLPMRGSLCMTCLEPEVPVCQEPALSLEVTREQITGKDFDAGRDWEQEEKETTDEMAGWHHRLDGLEFE